MVNVMAMPFCSLKVTSKLKILNNNYRDGNKSPETRFNKVSTHSSKTEQASEITMTPALYCRTIYIAVIYLL